MIYKRPGSSRWWYKFHFRGRRIQASARTTNKAAARQIEAAHRVRLAKGEAGIFERGCAPTLAAFAPRFLAECRARHGERKTERFYEHQVRRLLRDSFLATAKLDAIGAAEIAAYTARRRRSVSVATTNRQLATLRRMLRVAAEWGLIAAAPRVRLLAGEVPREYVLPRGDVEDAYIEAFPEIGGRMATLMIEAGLRGREVVGLMWADVVAPRAAQRGYLRVRRETAKGGKPRTIPLSERAWAAISAGPRSPLYVFGDPPPSLVVLQTWHRRARRKLGLPKEFVLHSLRHTCLTRLGEAGVDAFSIRAIAGHASVVTSQRYVHPVTDALDRAIGKAEILAAELATPPRTKRPEPNGPRRANASAATG